jgi:O-antigen ligase
VVKQAHRPADAPDVTTLADPVRSIAGHDLALTPKDARRWLPALLVGLAVGYALMPFAHAWGGRAPWALTKTAGPVLVALIAVRPWRTVRTSVLVVAACISVVALVVCLVTPPGWFGSDRAASYGLAAAMFVMVAGFARTRQRRAAIAALVVLGGGVQFLWAFLPWVGGGDSTAEMVGTFYWHNQFGAFLLAPVILGASFALANKAPWRLLGWIVVPFAVAGVVYSTSRGSQLALAVVWVCLAVLALRVRQGARRAVGRFILLSLLCVAVTFLIAGPPFFASWHLPWQATQARSATGGSLVDNSGYRVHMWRESVSVFTHNPIVGVGYGALARAAAKVTPAGWPRSPLSHDDYLQSLADGGLLLGLPFLIGCGWVAFRLARQLFSVARRRVADPGRVGIALAAATMMAHAAIDFDWSYPAFFATAAVVVGLAVSPAAVRRTSSPGSGRSRLTPMVAIAVLVAAVVTGAVAGHGGGIKLAVPTSAPTSAVASSPGGIS